MNKTNKNNILLANNNTMNITLLNNHFDVIP